MLQKTAYTTKTNHNPQVNNGRVTRCSECAIRIFDSPGQAALARIPFQAHLNLNVNGRCPGCAGYRKIDYVIQKEIETMLSSNGNNPESEEFSFDKVELNIEPPPGVEYNRVSKYAEAATVIEKSAPGKWHRMKLSGKKAAEGLKGHTYKKFKEKSIQLTGRIRQIDNDWWLYWSWTAPEPVPEPAEAEAPDES